MLIDSMLPAKRTMQRKRPQCFQIIFGNNSEEKKKTYLPIPGAPQVKRPLKQKNLIRLLEVVVSNGLRGHPSELSGKPPSMSLLFSFAVFPSETLLSFA